MNRQHDPSLLQRNTTTAAADQASGPRAQLSIADHRPASQAALQMRAMIDNSPQVTQMKAFQQQVDQSQAQQPVVQRQATGTPVIQLAKYGDSTKLGRRRYMRKPFWKRQNLDFKQWKKGREAQHLIPAQIGKEFGIDKDLINDAPNGMMMPSGRKRTNHLRDTSLDKGKLHHIKGGGAHPNYNKYVRDFVIKQGWVKGQVTRDEFIKTAKLLRLKNRPSRTGPAKGYVDDMK
jgi:hypothetical protein